MTKAFYAKQNTSGTWNHHVWKHKLQKDEHRCGIWAIWLNEQWMRYWNEAHDKHTFETFCMQHTTPVPQTGTL